MSHCRSESSARCASHLKDCDERLPERVKVAARFVLSQDEVELPAEQLHPEQREDNDEEKQQQQQAGD